MIFSMTPTVPPPIRELPREPIIVAVRKGAPTLIELNPQAIFDKIFYSSSATYAGQPEKEDTDKELRAVPHRRFTIHVPLVWRGRVKPPPIGDDMVHFFDD